MPFFYDNDGTLLDGEGDEVTGVPHYSEMHRTWAESQDWTRRGVGIMTLWFYGELCGIGLLAGYNHTWINLSLGQHQKGG